MTTELLTDDTDPYNSAISRSGSILLTESDYGLYTSPRVTIQRTV